MLEVAKTLILLTENELSVERYSLCNIFSQYDSYGKKYDSYKEVLLLGAI
ncbi:MAG: hypothetical protein ACFFAU_05165 [Candidatus Hodarchaeota archaeon]